MSEVEWRRLHKSSGMLYWETPFVNGRPHGIEKKYYKNGILQWEISFINGQLHGVSKTYHRDGTLQEESLWIRDKKRNDLLEDEHRLERLILLGEQG